MSSGLRRGLGLLAYWAIVVKFLRLASPVFFDGSGPTPSFYWGDMPLPDPKEYYGRQTHFDFIYWLPYLAVGLVITFVGSVVAPALLRRMRPQAEITFLRALLATLASLVFLAVLSDLGGRLRIWSGPVFFLHGDFSPHIVLALCQVFLPGSILSGIRQYWLKSR